MWDPNEGTEGGGGGGKAEEGTYPFKVDEATRKTWKSGNRGAFLKLLVGAFPDRDVTVFHRFTFIPSCNWKIKEFCDSTGVDFNRPIADRADEVPIVEWINLTGKARFVHDDKGYLVVDGAEGGWLPANANNTTAPVADDDIPF